ncbi:MAG: hypothetical protein ACKVS8_05670 [Phycisphaerales bacterium]
MNASATRVFAVRSLALVLAAGAAVACVPAAAVAGPAFDFEWAGGARTIIYNVEMSAENYVVNDVLDNMKRPRANAANYTMGDAFRLAINTWNYANAGGNGGGARPNPWLILPTGLLLPAVEALLPRINIKIGAVVAPPALGSGTAITPPTSGTPEFTPPMPMSGGSSDGMKRAKNDEDQHRMGGNGGVSDALMLFILKQKLNPTQWQTADIVVNPTALWGTTANANEYDPIIVAMHEIGHALRLDHDMVFDGFTLLTNTTIGPNRVYLPGEFGQPDGPIMRPFTDTGNNVANTLNGTIYDRYIDRRDLDFAGAASALAPTPGAATLLSLGGLLALRRRR